MNDERQPRILICDELDPAAMEVFRRRGLEPEVRTGLAEAELMVAARDVDAIVVRSATKITKNVIEASQQLRVVGRAGIGVDNIDLEAATARGIVVMNTPRGNATTTAELAITLLLSLARHIPRADKMVRSGVWKKKLLVGTEVTGKTLGVVGLGRIGRLVAERGRGLGMKVVGYDPYLEVEGSAQPVPGVTLMELDHLLEVSDFVSLHVPLTDTTRNMISWESLARIKPGARLIHVSRGGIVDEEAVLDALSSGRLAGAAFDVYVQEPPPADHPLLARDDVILTPHLGASSEEAQLRVALDIAEQISTFLLQDVAENAVNAPALPVESRGLMGPYLLLAEKLGSFLSQRMGGPMRKVEFTVSANLAKLGSEHLRLAFLVGCLSRSLERAVNFVNAPQLARERGILVLEGQLDDSESDYSQGMILVRATDKTGGDVFTVGGTVFGGEPRIVRVDDVRLDFPPSGVLLLTRHKDRPGALGRIGTILGNHATNIRRLELGPAREESDLAYGFLTLDSKPGPEVMAEIQALDEMVSVKLLEL